MTHVHLSPASGDGIVVLTNSQRSWQLIASLVSDWARWSGVGAVGMGAILLGARLLTVVVGLLLATAVWQAARLAIGLATARGRAAPWARGRIGSRLVRFAVAAAAGG